MDGYGLGKVSWSPSTPRATVSQAQSQAPLPGFAKQTFPSETAHPAEITPQHDVPEVELQGDYYQEEEAPEWDTPDISIPDKPSKAAASKPPPAPKAPKKLPDDPEGKMKLAACVRRYLANPRLGPKLAAFQKLVPEKMSVEQLKATVNSMQAVIQAGSNQGAMDFLFVSGLHAVENIGTQYVGLKLQGYAQHVMSNDAILDTFEEVKLLHDGLAIPLSPEQRLAMGLLQAAYIVHTINGHMPQAAPPIANQPTDTPPDTVPLGAPLGPPPRDTSFLDKKVGVMVTANKAYEAL